MAIGYLITAYDSPNHFARLLTALSGAEVFVHIDAKADIAAFRGRAHFLEDRVAVNWGEFSMVEAVLKLMTAALGHVKEFDYLCMLSGSDYPLRSTDYIEKFFEAHSGEEFITLVEMPNEAQGKTLDRLPRDYQQRLNGLRPYGGSPWWALSRQACEYALRFTREHPDLADFYRGAHIPEEMFLHTIIGNSPFHARVIRNVTFADWSRSPDSPHPAILDEHHLPCLTRRPLMSGDNETELLFARKFPDDSSSLIQKLVQDH